MDYRDYIDGQTGEQFWFRSKKDLINILMSKIGRKNLKILNIGAGTGVDLEIMNRFGILKPKEFFDLNLNLRLTKLKIKIDNNLLVFIVSIICVFLALILIVFILDPTYF